MRLSRLWVIVLAVATGAASSRHLVQPGSPSTELARYPGPDPTRRPPSIDALTHDQLATFIKQLREEGRRWVSQAIDDAPRRRLVFAALVLDVADAAQWWNRTEYEQVPSIKMTRAIRPLIEQACELLRSHPVGAPERRWMLASVAYGQGADATLLSSGRDAVTHETGKDHLAHAQAVLPEAKLMLRGNRAEAAALVDTMFAEPREELDPWILFSKGDYRRLPGYMTAIRRGLGR